MLAIITDSTCDIPEDLIQKFGIIVVSHVVIWGEEQFRDRVDLQPKAFYQRLQESDLRPTTAQAGVGDFLDGINQAKQNGADKALILTVSSAMSGAFNMAKTAAEQAEIPVTVVDSRGPSMSLGWQVLAAARARDAGVELGEILKRVDEVRGKMVQVVAMETLDYLQTGGRIGEAAKWVGSLLKVKPVVAINHEKGVVTPAGLARTHQLALEMLFKKFTSAIGEGATYHIAVLHGDAIEEAQKLAKHVQEAFNPVELLINITGPVLGINTGPGALALCGYAEAASS
jgi:DegV family protein with EDD domain